MQQQKLPAATDTTSRRRESDKGTSNRRSAAATGLRRLLMPAVRGVRLAMHEGNDNAATAGA